MKRQIGVVVGRFQVAKLTEGHKHLIKMALVESSRVLVFVGVSSVKNTKRQPLDYETRRKMILKEFPAVEIYPIHDQPDDKVWSEKLDAMIETVTNMNDYVCFFYGRDSFYNRYSGRYASGFQIETTVPGLSGSEQRDDLGSHVLDNDNFRAGVIYASQNRWPTVHPTVDVAIYDPSDEVYLFGRKKNEDKWRFIGGFVDTGDNSLITACRREAHEETNLPIDNITYIGSYKIHDWRYGLEPNESIMTNFFHAECIFGMEKASDDIHELRWVPVQELESLKMVDEHTLLLAKLIDYRSKL